MDEIVMVDGQAAPSQVIELGGRATADAGTGGVEKYGALSVADRSRIRVGRASFPLPDSPCRLLRLLSIAADYHER